MQCRNCRTLFYTDFCPNCGTPANPTEPETPFYHKWWFWFILVILFFVLVSIFDNRNLATLDSNSTISSHPANPTATTSMPKQKRYFVGDTFKYNGMQITYMKAEKWKSSESLYRPDPGYMIIRLKISAENTASFEQSVYSFHFTCYADGKKEDPYYYSDQDSLKGGTLSTGRRDEGYIYFSVPLDATVIEVEYDPFYGKLTPVILMVSLTN